MWLCYIGLRWHVMTCCYECRYLFDLLHIDTLAVLCCIWNSLAWFSRWWLHHRLDGLGDFGTHRGPSDGGVASLMDVQFEENPRCVLHFSLHTLECKQSEFIFFHENRKSGLLRGSLYKYAWSLSSNYGQIFPQNHDTWMCLKYYPQHLWVSHENRSLGDFWLSLTLALWLLWG